MNEECGMSDLHDTRNKNGQLCASTCTLYWEIRKTRLGFNSRFALLVKGISVRLLNLIAHRDNLQILCGDIAWRRCIPVLDQNLAT